MSNHGKCQPSSFNMLDCHAMHSADSDCLSNKDPVLWLAIQPCLIVMTFQCN